MLFSESKPIEEVLESLGDEKNIFLLACNGCAEICETGGQKGLDQMKTELEKAGKNITGALLVDFLCNKILVATRLLRERETIYKSDSILVMTCGIGVQATSKVIKKVVHPADNTMSVGGLQGLWPAEERCGACGDCALDYTGGICPVTFCAKGMLNGPCGGAKDGMCEVDSEKECGWQMIYDRLEQLGKLDNLKKVRKARKHSRMQPASNVKKSSFYNIEE